MKIVFITIALLGITGFAIKSISGRSGSRPKPASAFASVATTTYDTTGIAVVELFTSEGCSSCPSADALLAELDAEKKKDVYVLSYHVDYWDRLGWKDAFSKPEWTARQAAYVNHFNLESSYTPQAVVNGTKEFVGSGKLQLYTAVDNSLRKSGREPLQIKATKQGDIVNVTYTTMPLKNAVINFALVQSEASTRVGRGENSGKELHHINVVRDLISVPATQNSSAVSFIVPRNFSAGAYKVIAFMQNKTNFEIVSATKTYIQ
jgi:hypothetical protein